MLPQKYAELTESWSQSLNSIHSHNLGGHHPTLSQGSLPTTQEIIWVHKSSAVNFPLHILCSNDLIQTHDFPMYHLNVQLTTWHIPWRPQMQSELNISKMELSVQVSNLKVLLSFLYSENATFTHRVSRNGSHLWPLTFPDLYFHPANESCPFFLTTHISSQL